MERKHPLTVREAIDLLEDCPDDAPVLIRGFGCNQFSLAGVEKVSLFTDASIVVFHPHYANQMAPTMQDGPDAGDDPNG